MSAAARAAATNPTAAQTANLEANAAIERYRMHDFAGARSAALQALIDANQPAAPALRPLQPIAPRSAYAPAHSPYVQTGAPPLNLAGIAEVDADGFIAQARGSLQACRQEHSPNTGAATAQLVSAARDYQAQRFTNAQARSEAHDRPVRALAARDQSAHPVAALQDSLIAASISRRAHLAETIGLHDAMAIDENVDRHGDRAVGPPDGARVVERDAPYGEWYLFTNEMPALRTSAHQRQHFETALRVRARSLPIDGPPRCTDRTTTRRSSRRRLAFEAVERDSPVALQRGRENAAPAAPAGDRQHGDRTSVRAPSTLRKAGLRRIARTPRGRDRRRRSPSPLQEIAGGNVVLMRRRKGSGCAVLVCAGALRRASLAAAQTGRCGRSSRIRPSSRGSRDIGRAPINAARTRSARTPSPSSRSRACRGASKRSAARTGPRRPAIPSSATSTSRSREQARSRSTRRTAADRSPSRRRRAPRSMRSRSPAGPPRARPFSSRTR